MSRARAIAQSLSEQAIADEEIAEAIVLAAVCIEAARAYDGGAQADPTLELERLLVRFGRQARRSLAAILRLEGAAA